jgi:acyl carrier protein
MPCESSSLKDPGREVQRVTDADSLLEGGILDSLGVLALVGFIEKRYGIVVTEDEMMPEKFRQHRCDCGVRQRPGARGG